MFSSLITLPVRLGLRALQLGLQLTAAATDRALGVVGAVADAAGRDEAPGFDLDGEPLRAAPGR